MHIGTAIFIIAIIYFMIVSPGFRNFGFIAMAVAAVGLAVALINQH